MKRDWLWLAALVALGAIGYWTSIEIPIYIWFAIFVVAMLIYVGRSLDRLHDKVDKLKADRD